jgi:hypothetical protein
VTPSQRESGFPVGSGIPRTAWKAHASTVLDELKETAHPTRVGKAERNSVRVGRVAAEISDALKTALIFARPAYIAGQWLGNTAMSLIHQGAYAPSNLARSAFASRIMNRGELDTLDSLTGMSRIEAHFEAGSAVSAVVRPVVSVMSKAADTPFRRGAVLHEMRRDGHRSLKDIKAIIARARKGDQEAIEYLANVGARAKQHVLDFRRLSDAEKTFVSRIVFVYPFVKAGGRYSKEFAGRHPVLTGLTAPVGAIGEEHAPEGVPGYLDSWINVGGGKLANPQSINPVGIGQELIDVGGNLAGLDMGEGAANLLDMLNPALGSSRPAKRVSPLISRH